MHRVLTPDFFNRDADVVARALLGTFLVRRVEGREVALMITETEAYHDGRDLASHARFGKTARTAPMFGKPGTIYIYFTYGMHFMLNLVCREAGHPSAVLIRAAGGIVGPARLTKALKVDKKLNNQLLGKKLGVWVEDRGMVVPPRAIQKTPRIGVAYAGLWAHKPLRFVFASQVLHGAPALQPPPKSGKRRL